MMYLALLSITNSQFFASLSPSKCLMGLGNTEAATGEQGRAPLSNSLAWQQQPRLQRGDVKEPRATQPLGGQLPPSSCP